MIIILVLLLLIVDNFAIPHLAPYRRVDEIIVLVKLVAHLGRCTTAQLVDRYVIGIFRVRATATVAAIFRPIAHGCANGATFFGRGTTLTLPAFTLLPLTLLLPFPGILTVIVIPIALGIAATCCRSSISCSIGALQ
uniref:Secreted protein n=1 Tax=Anopheles darlingi TaxID=43151 RepID=A0A2M4DL21_ANODA